MWQIVRNIVMAAFAAWTLSKVGPSVVDQYFLPTIEGVANVFHAVAPLPPSPTVFTQIQTPMAAASRIMAFETTFVKPAVFESPPEAAMITGIHPRSHSSSQHDDYESAPSLPWSFRIYQAVGPILLKLRHFFDNLFFQLGSLTAFMISWQLHKRRTQMTIRHIMASHKLEMTGLQDEFSARASVTGSEITALNAQIAHRGRVLRQAAEVIDAKTSTEEQSRAELNQLMSELKNKDNAIAERETSLAEAVERADKAEKSNAALVKDAKNCRSDFESALQKKNNDVETHKRTAEQAKKNEDTIRRELKDTINELRAKVADEKNLRKEAEARTSKQEARVADEKSLRSEADARMSKQAALVADERRLRKEADARVSKQEDRIGKANSLRKEAEAMALKEKTRAAEAFEHLRLARVKASEQEALAIHWAQQDAAKAAIMKAQENRIDVLTSQIADLLEQTNGRGEESQKAGTEKEETGIQGGKQDVQVNAQDTPLDNQTGTDGSQEKKKKQRVNRRKDGSIRTATHPDYTPPRPQPVGGKQAEAVERPGDGPSHSDVQSDMKPSSPRPAPRALQHGNRLHGARRHLDAHESPATSTSISTPPQQSSQQALPPASTQQAERPRPSDPFNPHPQRPTCAFFEHGYCKFGARCRDYHAVPQRPTR